VVDAAEPGRLARFWAQALGWDVAAEEADEVDVWPPGFSYPDPSALPLVFVPVSEPKTGKNRVHLDLATESAAHQAAEVKRLLALGAVRADIGQRDVPWTVLADPEGNEFCVLDPRPEYQDTGPVAAVVADCADPARMADFWALATGWAPAGTVSANGGTAGGGTASSAMASGETGTGASLRSPDGCGPYLELLPSAGPKLVKNRIHLDVAPYQDEDQAAAVRALTAAGAVLLDIGQGDVPWTVLADPEGSEFCVLSPR
jgi:Glyoxalase-like domain